MNNHPILRGERRGGTLTDWLTPPSDPSHYSEENLSLYPRSQRETCEGGRDDVTLCLLRVEGEKCKCKNMIMIMMRWKQSRALSLQLLPNEPASIRSGPGGPRPTISVSRRSFTVRLWSDDVVMRMLQSRPAAGAILQLVKGSNIFQSGPYTVLQAEEEGLGGGGGQGSPSSALLDCISSPISFPWNWREGKNLAGYTAFNKKISKYFVKWEKKETSLSQNLHKKLILLSLKIIALQTVPSFAFWAILKKILSTIRIKIVLE